MSPILVRPVREQLEHDRVIRLLQAKLKRKHDVAINVADDQSAAVRVGTGQMFPDLVLSSQDKAHRLEGVIEVETGESVNHLEAMAQWAHFGPRPRAVHPLRPLRRRGHRPAALHRERRGGLRAVELPLARRSDALHAHHQERGRIPVVKETKPKPKPRETRAASAAKSPPRRRSRRPRRRNPRRRKPKGSSPWHSFGSIATSAVTKRPRWWRRAVAGAADAVVSASCTGSARRQASASVAPR